VVLAGSDTETIARRAARLAENASSPRAARSFDQSTFRARLMGVVHSNLCPRTDRRRRARSRPTLRARHRHRAL